MLKETAEVGNSSKSKGETERSEKFRGNLRTNPPGLVGPLTATKHPACISEAVLLREDAPATGLSRATIASGGEAKTLAGAAFAAKESGALSQLIARVINLGTNLKADESGDKSLEEFEQEAPSGCSKSEAISCTP